MNYAEVKERTEHALAIDLGHPHLAIESFDGDSRATTATVRILAVFVLFKKEIKYVETAYGEYTNTSVPIRCTSLIATGAGRFFGRSGGPRI